MTQLSTTIDLSNNCILQLMKFNNCIIFIVFLCLSICPATTTKYMQFLLSRASLPPTYSQQCSILNQKASSIFTQVCYGKDISYRTDLYIDSILYFVSMDLTAPYSWLKSPECKTNPTVNCSIIYDRDRSIKEKEFRDVRQTFKLFGDKTNQKTALKTTIAGSSDRIEGQLHQINQVQFYGKDSTVMKEFIKIIELSLFFISQRESIQIRNISLVKAEKVSSGVNELADGAISLRNSKQSQNSCFFQLMKAINIYNKIITIYLNPRAKQGIISIGEVSLKYTRSRINQIKWISLKPNELYGYTAIAESIVLDAISITTKTAYEEPTQILLSTSTTYLFFPTNIIEWLESTLKERTNAKCTHSNQYILSCRWKNEQDKRKLLPLHLYIKVGPKQTLNISIITLINIAKDNNIQFTIKESTGNVIILGQPLFEEYLIFLDYDNNKLGFAPVFVHYSERYSMFVVYFLRIIFGINLALIFTYLFYSPLSSCCTFIQRRWNRLTTAKKIVSSPPSYDQLPQIDIST